MAVQCNVENMALWCGRVVRGLGLPIGWFGWIGLGGDFFYFWLIELGHRSKTRSSSSAIAEGPREALVSRNPATTKHLT